MKLSGAACVVAALVLSVGAGQACIVAPHALAIPGSLTPAEDASTQVYRAWFSDPTTRYSHGVLGDGVEAGALYAYSTRATNFCQVIQVTLDENHVFEDIAPRLVDLDGDGVNEIIVVRTSLTQGAQLAVYGDAGDGQSLALLAATPFIGRPNRWLAPIGAADLDGDGYMEIAYIDRPHLARTLRIWRYQNETLTEVAAASGLTNHRIGQNVISSGIRDCGDGPEMITVDTDWAQVLASRFDGEAITARSLGAYTADRLAAALTCDA